MRLPFGLGRRSSSGDGASGGRSDASPPTVSRSAASGSGAVPARPRAWASLPPIQRTAGSMPLVAAPGDFAGALPGTQGLPPVVQQLGHEVSPLATPGLVVARVRAVEQVSGGSIPAPVQRRARRTAQRQADTGSGSEAFTASEPEPIEMPLAAPLAPSPSVSRSASSSAGSSAAPVVARSAATESAGIDPGGDDDEISVGSTPAPDMTPVRSLPTVSRSAIRVPDRPLTSAASVVRPLAQRSHAGHSHQPSAAEGGQAPATPLPAPSGGMRRAPSNPAVSRTAMPTASRQAEAPAAAGSPTSSTTSASPSAPAPAASALPALAPVSSRRGVGEPTSLPAAARPIGAAAPPVVSRSTMAGPMPLATSSLRTTIQRAAEGGDGEDDGEEAPVQRSAASPGTFGTPSNPGLPSLPVLSVSRSAREGAPSGPVMTATTPASTGSTGSSFAGAPGSAPAAAGSAHVQRSASPAIRPIAAHNPLRPSIPLQREADGEPGDGEDEGDGGLPSPWWAPAAERPAAMPTLPTLPTSAGADGGPAVQRSAFALPAHASAAASPVTAMRAAAGGPTWAGQSVQRSVRGSSPAPRLPVAVAPTTAASHATHATSPVATPDWGAPGTTVVFPQRSITSDPVVQTSRSGSTTTPSATTPTVQRESTTASPAPAGGAGVGSQAGSAAREQHSERELDDLARQLFGRIRTRLRADLLQDREAAGFTFDNV